MNGHVFLSSYISYAEAVLAHFWSMRPELEDEPVYTVSKITCNLHRPLHYDDIVEFNAAVDKIGVRSVGFLIAIEVEDERAAEVEIIWQAHERENQALVAIPEETRDWLYTFLD